MGTRSPRSPAARTSWPDCRGSRSRDWTLTRADYAMTLLDVAETPHMIGRALGVGGAKPHAKGSVKAV
ncbi:MAG TPA: hypothetical protein VEL76_00660 [Gemmataceae bacterium]|nr:hypothetical protein [Gemmataceae bacterium]